MVARRAVSGIWYVVMTKPQRENWARENVLKQGAEPYLPRVSPTEVLFPSYMFVCTTGAWRFLRGTFGVMDVVAFGESPAQVPHRDIAGIRALEGPDGFVQLPDWQHRQRLPRPGEEVEVRSGLFEGSRGLCEGMPGHDRVCLLLDLLGRRTRVTLDVRDLRDGKQRRRW